MNAESGDDDKDVMTSEWGGEARQDWRLNVFKWASKLLCQGPDPSNDFMR